VSDDDDVGGCGDDGNDNDDGIGGDKQCVWITLCTCD
jgi:hypothetical protein